MKTYFPGENFKHLRSLKATCPDILSYSPLQMEANSLTKTKTTTVSKTNLISVIPASRIPEAIVPTLELPNSKILWGRFRTITPNVRRAPDKLTYIICPSPFLPLMIQSMRMKSARRPQQKGTKFALYSQLM